MEKRACEMRISDWSLYVCLPIAFLATTFLAGAFLATAFFAATGFFTAAFLAGVAFLAGAVFLATAFLAAFLAVAIVMLLEIESKRTSTHLIWPPKIGSASCREKVCTYL